MQDLKIVIISLPKDRQEAIVEKYRREQLMLAYKFQSSSASSKKPPKRTEATSIRNFNQSPVKRRHPCAGGAWSGQYGRTPRRTQPCQSEVVLGGSGQGALRRYEISPFSASSMPQRMPHRGKTGGRQNEIGRSKCRLGTPSRGSKNPR